MLSMINDPLINPAKAGPKKVTTGRRPPLSAWRVTTQRGDAPFARAVRM